MTEFRVYCDYLDCTYIEGGVCSRHPEINVSAKGCLNYITTHLGD